MSASTTNNAYGSTSGADPVYDPSEFQAIIDELLPKINSGGDQTDNIRLILMACQDKNEAIVGKTGQVQTELNKYLDDINGVLGEYNTLAGPNTPGTTVYMDTTKWREANAAVLDKVKALETKLLNDPSPYFKGEEGLIMKQKFLDQIKLLKSIEDYSFTYHDTKLNKDVTLHGIQAILIQKDPKKYRTGPEANAPTFQDVGVKPDTNLDQQMFANPMQQITQIVNGGSSKLGAEIQLYMKQFDTSLDTFNNWIKQLAKLNGDMIRNSK